MNAFMKFRQQAIDHINQQAQFDQSPNIIQPHAWIILLTIACMVVGLIFWGIWGSVKSQVVGKGILLTENGQIYSVASPFDSSQVTDILVQSGETVKQNTVIIKLSHPELAKQIRVIKNYIKILKLDYSELNQEAEKSIAEMATLFEQKRKMIDKVIAVEMESMEVFDKLAKKYNKMLERGLSTELDQSRAHNNLADSKQSLEQSHQQLIQIQIQIEKKKYQQSWRERLRSLNQKIKSEEYKLQDLSEKQKLLNIVKSPIDGIVLGLHASKGDVFRAGQPMMNMSTLGDGLDVMAYFKPEFGKKIKVGMHALVSPLNIKAEEYGSLVGEVIEVSPFPINKNVMMSILKNESLVKNFAQDSAPLMIKIRIVGDDNNFSQFKWSSSGGPKESITPGTIATVKITVKRHRPIYLVAPFFKKVMGSD